MAYDDRDYAQPGRPNFGSNPFMWLVYGRVPLFRVFGVNVFAHASMIVISVFVLLLGTGYFGNTFFDRLTFIGVLFGIVLLHEFGHVFAARWSGGEANEIELTPLGGLAMARPGKGWYNHTVTIVGGPLVNVIICLVCGIILGAWTGFVPLGPFSFGDVFSEMEAYTSAGPRFVLYVYTVSYFLLLFNLLPIYPLDGGQILQGLLWWKLGWYWATMYATTIGIAGGILLGLYGLFTFRLLMLFIGLMCFMNCLRLNRALKAEGPWGFSEMDEPDYAASLKDEEPTWAEKRAAAKEQKRIEREEAAAAAKAAEIDRILAKIGESGRESLTKKEVAALEEHRAELQKRG
ncbi:MAG: M50 family metallopeptidase [Planctomycetota bacterium]